jgi:hypothetical protein
MKTRTVRAGGATWVVPMKKESCTDRCAIKEPESGQTGNYYLLPHSIHRWIYGCPSTGQEMSTLTQLTEKRWLTPQCRKTVPSIKGVPFKVSDSSSGHQRFNESTDGQSEIRVKERDKCVNLKGK